MLRLMMYLNIQCVHLQSQQSWRDHSATLKEAHNHSPSRMKLELPIKPSLHGFVLWEKLERTNTTSREKMQNLGIEPPAETSAIFYLFYLKTRLSQRRNKGTSLAFSQDKLIIRQSLRLNEQSLRQLRDPFITHQEHIAKRPRQTGLSELTGSYLPSRHL